MRKFQLAVIVGIVSFLSVQVRAQDSQTLADVRCVIVGFRLADLNNPTYRVSGTMLSLYYLGRLDGRTPHLNLEKLVVAQLKTMTPAGFRTAAKRCGAALTVKGQEITKVGQDLVKQGRKMLNEAAKPTT